MRRQNIARIVRWAIIIWFIMLPLFWQFNLSVGENGYYDVFSMAPSAVFHLVVFFILVLCDIYLRKPSLIILLLLSLYFPAIQLVNYPHLTYRDVYLHAAPVETILADGQLNYTRDSGPQSWPASFDLHGISSIVLGLGLVNANYLLYFVISVVLTLTSYSFARKLEEKGHKLAAYSPILFQCLFANYFFDFNHYSRATLEFIFLFLFFFSFLFLKGRRGHLVRLLSTIAVFTVHPFASLALATFAASYFLLSSAFTRARLARALARARRRQFSFALLSIVGFVSWFIFVGSEKFGYAIERIRTFLSPQYIAPFSESFVISESFPWWGSILREYFRYSLITLMAIASVAVLYLVYIRLRRDRNDDILVGLSSLVIMSVVVVGGLFLLPDWGITRGLAFLAFPSAFTSLFLVDRMARNRKSGRLGRFSLPIKRVFLPILVIFIVTLSATVMVLRFERNYYFGEMTHTNEQSSLSFFFHYDSRSPVAILSWRTAVYSGYYNYRGIHTTLRFWYTDLDNLEGNSSKLLQLQRAYINQSQAVIRGMRDEFDFAGFDSPRSLLRTIDEEMILPKFDQIYCNQEYTLFEKPSNIP